MSSGIPAENVCTYVEAAHEYGTYPINIDWIIKQNISLFKKLYDYKFANN